MEGDDVACYGKTQPGSAGGRARGIEPVKLLENAPQLLLGDSVSAVNDADGNVVAVKLRVYHDLGVGIAVQHRVAQEIIENSLHFAGVAAYRQRIRRAEGAGERFFLEHGHELEPELLEQTHKVYARVIERNGR